MSVSLTSAAASGSSELTVLLHLTEFLNLRKVPLRERAYLDDALEDSRAVDPNQPGPSNASMQSHAADPAAFRLMEELRDIVLTDRELADKVCGKPNADQRRWHGQLTVLASLYQAAKAYVSAVRAYSKHEASYIFQLKDLDLFGLGVAFGCLRLPKMPEVRAWKDRLQKVKKVARRVEEAGDLEAVLPEVPGDGIAWKDRELDVSAHSALPCCFP
jgi:ATP-dependent RNA helicase DDX55/SPB4